jgi:methionine aminopeptidase
LRSAVVPGVTTGELDRLAAEAFAASGARSGPILTYGYPASICVCVDDEVVHAILGPHALQGGQLVTLDVAAELHDYHADAAITVPVGAADGTASAHEEHTIMVAPGGPVVLTAGSEPAGQVAAPGFA